MKLVGDVKLMHKFKTLPQTIQNKAARPALAKAARRIVKAAKARCPVETGQLRKSLGFKPRTYKSGVYTIVGPRTGFRVVVNNVPHDPAKIAHLVEMGHGGPHAAPAHPFLRPAMDETARGNAQLIADMILERLEIECKD